MENLKAYIRNYRQLDDEIREINNTVYEKRKARSELETQITEIIKQPQFNAYDKLKIEDDGSVLKIKRPDTWNKPWSLSKAQLEEYLDYYFESAKTPTAEECYKYIINSHNPTLVGKEFVIERIVSSKK